MQMLQGSFRAGGLPAIKRSKQRTETWRPIPSQHCQCNGIVVCHGIRDEDSAGSSSRDLDPQQQQPATYRHPEMEATCGASSHSAIPDALPVSGADTDWREFRARLVASTRSASSGVNNLPEDQQTSTPQGTGSPARSGARWAHSLPRPEKGCLLLAHPLMFQNSEQEYFYQAVILITEHNEHGSFGVILNRPSMYKLAELSLTYPLPEFDDLQLYVGGDVGGGEITLLHVHDWLPQSAEVIKGVYMGGIHASQAAVASGKAKPTDFRFFAKYAGWGPGQLEMECRRGVWFTVAASPAVILAEPKEATGSDMWHGVLGLLGGDFALMSERVRDKEQEQRDTSSR